jgi:hypothetical protein
MKPIHTILAVVAILWIVGISGCSKKEELSVNDESEETNVELTLNDQYDKVRNGARLILNYDPHSNSFKGTVENTTNETLKRVRVEVHLSNGKELGPTTPEDLAPGDTREVLLAATSTNFDKWTAHPEVGDDEHGSSESRGEHDRERSEHGSGESRGEHEREGESEHE